MQAVAADITNINAKVTEALKNKVALLDLSGI